jgi:ATP-dependent DNA helicase RecG
MVPGQGVPTIDPVRQKSYIRHICPFRQSLAERAPIPPPPKLATGQIGLYGELGKVKAMGKTYYKTINIDSIDDILNAPEGENVEFKEAKNTYEFDNIVKYSCALANCGGGIFVLGVSDRRPRKITGTNAFLQPERTRESLIKKLQIRVDFRLNESGGKRVLVFEIAGRPFGLPVQADGVIWWREGDSLVKMPPEVLRNIYAETGHDFSGDICTGASIADLDEMAIDAFRKKWEEKTGNTRLQKLGVEQLLRDCEALVDTGLTYAALVLFGKHSSLGRLLPQVEIVFEYRSTESSGPAQQREEFRTAFFSCYDRLWELINLRNDKQHYQDGLFVFDVPMFNERVVREALLNAVCHRNYQLGGSIFVRQYQNRLVIDSPGGFPMDITLDNILDRQSPRNRRIAEILSRCGLVERSGQGMNLIYELSVKEAKSLPDFSGTDANLVRITLNGLVLNKNMLLLINTIGNERLESFSTEDFLVINSLFYDQKLPENLRGRTKRLIDMGIIEHVSRNKFVLARVFYRITGKTGLRTRYVGLDKETNKELLYKHIKENEETGSPFFELQQVLPGHSRDQIKVLLRDLQEQGKIFSTGKTRGARWHAKP